MEASKRGRKVAIAISTWKNKDTALDGSLWGKLQEHIKLNKIYQKLPPKELTRLRLVCKSWNDAALRTLESKSYFVTEQKQHLDGEGSDNYEVDEEGYERISEDEDEK